MTDAAGSSEAPLRDTRPDTLDATAELLEGPEHEPIETPAVVGDLSPTAAHARLGSEGLLRLRGRYADILAGIHDRIPDGPRREELKAQAERLNPDNWVTEEEVRSGLEQYESVFESLRPVAGRRRRRRRRRPGNPL